MAFWMYYWEQAQSQRFHPLSHRLGSWMLPTMRQALVIALVGVVASAISGERCTKYNLGATAFIFCWVLVLGLTSWLVRGPKGLYHKLARSRYCRKMRGTAHYMAARKTEINLGRFHHLLFTADNCIHRTELDEVEAGSKISERTETITSWAAIERIEVTPHHAFLIEQRNSTTILPRRAFPDEPAFQQFVNLAQRLHLESLRGSAARSDERIMR